MDDTTPVTEKRCTKCGETKPLDEFHKDRNTKVGHAAYCRPCSNARATAYRVAHPEKAKAAKGRSYAAKRDEYCAKNRARHTANLERYEARRAEYRAANRDRASERARQWHVANPERKRQQRDKWKRDNPDKLLTAQRERRARKKGAEIGLLDNEQWASILNYFGHACGYCGVQNVPLTQDHIVALSRGGAHTAANVIPACTNCNSQKFASPLWRFLLNRSQRHE